MDKLWLSIAHPVRAFIYSWMMVAAMAHVGAAAPDDAQVEAFRKSAGEAWREGNYGKALPDYTKLIESDPQNYGPYLSRGFCYFLNRQWDEAIADFQKADTLYAWADPMHGWTRVHLFIWAARVFKGEGAAATDAMRTEIERSQTLVDLQKAAKPFPDAPSDHAMRTFEKGMASKKKETSWDDIVAKFLTGKICEKEFVPPEKPPTLKRGKNHAIYRPANIESPDALFFAALKRLADGDRKGAVAYFDRYVKSGDRPYQFEYRLAKDEVTALRAAK